MRKFYIFALVAMLFAACTTDKIQDVQLADTSETLTVSFEDGDEDTRIQLQNGKTVWSYGDLVSVFYRSNANQQWRFQGETGERSGTIKRVTNADATQELSNIVVVYPYNANYYINPRSFNVQAFLPAEQRYLRDSYGRDGNIMISSSEYKQFSLKNVCGWLKLQITGDAVIDYITLKGNNGEQVAGEIYINSEDASCELAADAGVFGDDTEVGGTMFEDGTVLTSVTLECGGVTLSSEPTAFYIALPPQTFEKGLTVEIETTDGKIMTKSTDKSLTIERNTIQPMAVFEANTESFDMPSQPSQPIPANNEIWYTNGSTTKATAPYKTDIFGATIISNLYDVEKECWVITFDGYVTKIGDRAFSYCRSLTSVTIGNSVTSIGAEAFSDCTSLTSITIPDSVTSIGDYAFSGCDSLNNVVIPDRVTSIGSGAFQNCDSLTSITIPDSVTSIGGGAFRGCTSLKEFCGKFASSDNRCLIIDNVLISFADCGLNSYTFPHSITSIGEGAISNSGSLFSITIPDSVTEIREFAFSSCSSLVSITIPDSVTSIGYCAFSGCSSLTSITIPDSVTSMGDGTFEYCSSLTSVKLGEGITTIGSGAFVDCKSLTTIRIGEGVTSIETAAFYNCTSLKTVYCMPITPPELGSEVFSYSNYENGFSQDPIGCKIYVPAKSVDAYKSRDNWGDYASDIVGYDF